MRERVLEKFERLNVWTRGAERAPHKPLLVLLALGRWSRGDLEEVPFREVDDELRNLLQEFGPQRQVYHPEYPFWRLQNDGVWRVVSDADAPLESRQSNTDPRKSELLQHGARGRFTDDVLAELRKDPSLASEIARHLLDAHFPESIHSDITSAVGLATDLAATQRKRDPRFRQRVLVTYEFRCAVCAQDIRLGSATVGLDAAHIKWHQAGGADDETNGLALCVWHHKLFDLGAFTLRPDLKLLVSDLANGTTGLHENLLAFHGQALRSPQRQEHRPDKEALGWHTREVFKGSPRPL